MPTVLLNGLNACADVDPEVFYPETLEGIEKAKAICATCPDLIRKRCLEVGLSEPKQHGVWGGVSAADRRKMRPRSEAGKRHPGPGRAQVSSSQVRASA